MFEGLSAAWPISPRFEASGSRIGKKSDRPPSPANGISQNVLNGRLMAGRLLRGRQHSFDFGGNNFPTSASRPGRRNRMAGDWRHAPWTIPWPTGLSSESMFRKSAKRFSARIMLKQNSEARWHDRASGRQPLAAVPAQSCLVKN